jgi:HAD superfamily hydrolase (TIGR01509 family)
MNSSPPSDLRAVIFDLDGVLLDSRQANEAFYNHILEVLGLPPMSPADVEVVHRESMEGSLRHLVGEGDKYEAALAYWREMDPTPFIRRLRLFPGAHQTLARLQQHLPLAVATNRTKTTTQVLQHLELEPYFQVVVTPLDAGVPKPDPRVLSCTLERLGLERHQVVYVGDSSVDESLCRAGGVRLVAFRNPTLQAWAHIDELPRLPPLLGLE